MSYLEIPVKVCTEARMKFRLVGPSDTAPEPAEGFLIDPEPIEISDVDGKLWMEYQIITP